MLLVEAEAEHFSPLHLLSGCAWTAAPPLLASSGPMTRLLAPESHAARQCVSTGTHALACTQDLVMATRYCRMAVNYCPASPQSILDMLWMMEETETGTHGKQGRAPYLGLLLA
jgi:hypothetical protein